MSLRPKPVLMSSSPLSVKCCLSDSIKRDAFMSEVTTSPSPRLKINRLVDLAALSDSSISNQNPH